MKTIKAQHFALGIALFVALAFVSTASQAVMIGGIMDGDSFDNSQDSEGTIVEIDNDGTFDFIDVDMTFETGALPIEGLSFGDGIASFTGTGQVNIFTSIVNDTDFDWDGYNISIDFDASPMEGLQLDSPTVFNFSMAGLFITSTNNLSDSIQIGLEGELLQGEEIFIGLLINVTSDQGPVSWDITHTPQAAMVVQPPAVPEPTSLALMGLALGLFGVKRRA